MRQRSGGFFTMLIFGPGFMVIGCLIGWFFALPMWNEAKASKEWPTADGVITVSRVQSHRNKDGKSMYSHEVEFKYTLDGEQHVGDRIWATDGGSSSNSSAAHATVAMYPVGRDVTVHYDPEAPGVALLEPGTTWVNFLLLGVSAMFFLIGLLITGSLLVKIFLGTLAVGAVAGKMVSQTPQTQGNEYDPSTSSFNSSNEDDGIGVG
jgi:hypothetical protein